MQTNPIVHPSIDKLFNIVGSEHPIVNKEIVEEIEDVVEEKKGDETETTTPTKVVEKVTQKAAESTADTFIWLIDFLQKNIFKFFAKRKQNKRAIAIAGENGKQRLLDVLSELKTTRESKKDVTETNEREDKLLLQLNTEVNEFIEALDLTTDEKNMLREPLKEMAKIKNLKMSPEMSLFIACAMIASTRIGVYYSI